MAEREGVTIPHTASPGLQLPEEGIPLWIANLNVEGCSQGTIAQYARVVKKYLARDPCPTPLTIRQYLAERLSQVSATVVSMERKALKSFFGYLHEQGLWPTNPVAGIKAIRPRHREREVPSLEDIEKLMMGQCYRRADTFKYRIMLSLLVDTGLRIGEGCRLRTQGVDLDHRQIRVQGKGGRERLVPISPPVAELLSAWMRYNGHSPWLFPGQGRGGYWDVSGFQQMLKRMCRRLGIRPISPHQLRHAFATHSLRRGMKIEIVSRILGHAQLGTTMIYRHIDLAEVHDEHKRYGPFNGAPGALLTDSEAGDSESNGKREADND